MTKSEHIIALYDGVRRTGEIADIVGCSAAYVRVVARQRKGGGRSPIDIRYRKKHLDRIMVREKQRARAIGAYQATLRSALRSGHDQETAYALARSALRDEQRKQDLAR